MKTNTQNQSTLDKSTPTSLTPNEMVNVSGGRQVNLEGLIIEMADEMVESMILTGLIKPGKTLGL